MSLNDEFELRLPRFVSDFPDDRNAYRLRPGTWKFDFESMTSSEIDDFLRSRDNRPRRCSELFPNFGNFRIIEFGPSDGYNTAQLELFGAKDIVSIEANADAFLRCLILKNARNLRTKFLLGDFVRYVSESKEQFDLAYASGVLYHLQDPVQFLLDCGKMADNLFIWTLYYDEDAIKTVPREMARFRGVERKQISGQSFDYHRRYVDDDVKAKPKYQGSILDHANWLSLSDIKKAVELSGFRIIHTVPNNLRGLLAMNIWASKLSVSD